MTRLFTPAELDDLTRRCTRMLDQMRDFIRASGPDLIPVARQAAELGETYGRRGMEFAFRAWFDTVLAATPGAPEPAMRGEASMVQVMFTNERDNVFMPAETIAVEHYWAAEALAAHFNGDHTRFHDLVEMVPSEPRSCVLHMLRALEMAATTLEAYDSPGAGGLRPGLYRFQPEPSR